MRLCMQYHDDKNDLFDELVCISRGHRCSFFFLCFLPPDTLTLAGLVTKTAFFFFLLTSMHPLFLELSVTAKAINKASTPFRFPLQHSDSHGGGHTRCNPRRSRIIRSPTLWSKTPLCVISGNVDNAIGKTCFRHIHRNQSRKRNKGRRRLGTWIGEGGAHQSAHRVPVVFCHVPRCGRQQNTRKPATFPEPFVRRTWRKNETQAIT